jgi:signal transduction histidine kinase
MQMAAPPDPTDLKNQLAFETLISDVSAKLVAAPDQTFASTIETALEETARFFGADRGQLLSVHAPQSEVRVLHAWYADTVESSDRGVPASSFAEHMPWAADLIVTKRQPLVMSALDELPPEAQRDRASFTAIGVRSAVWVPIAIGPDLRYMLSIEATHGEVPWPHSLVRRLPRLGEIFGRTVERKRVADARKLAEAEHRANIARMEAAVDAAGLGFYLMSDRGETAILDDRMRALFGIPPEQEPRIRTFWLEHVHPDDRDRVIQASRDVIDGGVERLTRVYRYQHPMRGLVWYQHTTRTFERDSSGRATRVAGVVQDITEQKRTEEELRTLSRRLIQAQEAERALLARDLHDDVTQRMAVLAIELGRAESSAPGGVQSETLRTVREGLVRLSEDIHALAYQLHPSVLEELGLAEALRTECERRGRHGGIDVTLDLDPVPGAVGKDATLCLYRVAQEALNNVARHARAHTASVVLRQVDGGLLLAIRDDGVGFEPGKPRARGSLGLVSMRERLRLVNGTLDIESAPGQGTVIVAWVPGEGGPQ